MLWTGGSLLTALLVVAVVIGLWVHGLVDKVGNLSADVKATQSSLQTLPTSGQPVTALVIGSDYRAGDGPQGTTGSRSDTLMLVRIDPHTKYISLLSLPRDLHVTIPGYGVDKINAAYSDGGYKLALKTVELATDVHPNYLITVDFKGFRDLVNKFHGVYVPVDQHYYHVNTPGTEQYSQIDIPPGYQLLNGTNGLAFSRYRHTDSDFYRNARQQVFLHAFTQRASGQLHGIGLDQISTFKGVAETIANNVQVTGPNGAPGMRHDDQAGHHRLRDPKPGDQLAAGRRQRRRRHRFLRERRRRGAMRQAVFRSCIPRARPAGRHAAGRTAAARRSPSSSPRSIPRRCR